MLDYIRRWRVVVPFRTNGFFAMRWSGTIVKLAVVAAICMTAAPSRVVAAGVKRLALVVANSSYVHTTALTNPVSDAALIGDKLRQLGFEVQFARDVGARQFSEIIEEFKQKLDKNSEVLFYYAGHGLQFRGENFLVGIDARLNSEATLQFETYKLNTVLNLLEQRAGTTLLFWDACRD